VLIAPFVLLPPPSPSAPIAEVLAEVVAEVVADTRVTFEAFAAGSLPPGWSADARATRTFTIAVCDDVASEGAQSLRATPVDTTIDGPSRRARRGPRNPGVVWTLDTEPYRGSVVKLTLAIRGPQDSEPQISLAIDRPNHAAPFRGRLVPVGGAIDGWRRFEIEAGIADDAQPLALSINVDSEIWIDDVQLARVASLAERPFELTRMSAAALAHADATPFALRSEKLSAFLGRDAFLRASIVAPEGIDLATLPVCYQIHGFGGDHIGGLTSGAQLKKSMRERDYPRMVYVFLDGSCPLGHHEFADSDNNGPWGTALISELLPALEATIGGVRDASRRFVTGHSSGGWSALWLQVMHPDFFGGCWATAPDSVDFRDWSGINLYTASNVFRNEAGEARPLVMRGTDVSTTVEAFVRGELAEGSTGGQLASFDAVFSSRGTDGLPLPMFDRTTGAIDRAVVDAWKRYDIGMRLREQWKECAPKLQGKLHVWIGDQDTYRLQGAVALLKSDLARLGSDADVIIVEGRDHGSLFAPHDELWPAGMMERIHREMIAQSESTAR